MSKKIELREYQKESVKEVSFSLSRGLRTLLCLPTGAGKTLVAKEIVDEYLDAGLTVLWITHRCELKSQVLGVFGENARFEVCLVKSRSSLKKVDLIVVDEAHHSAAPSYRSHFKQFPKAKVFGLSATPVRLDGKSLKDYFDIIIQPRSALTSALINQGFLADIELFVPDSTELNLCGEVIANSLNVRKSVLDGLKFIEGRKGITFCVNKAHALAVAEEFQRNGIEAEAIDSETPYDDRMKLADRWNENKIQVIVNCELYTEGSDLPGVDFVQILRPTESLSLYFQMIGRGMRPGPPMRLLDHTSNWKTIGLPKDDFIFTLDAGNEDAYFKLADEVKKIRREKQSGDQPEHVDLGDLVEFNLRDWYDQLKESRSNVETPIVDAKAGIWHEILSNIENLPARAIMSTNCDLVDLNGDKVKIRIRQRSGLDIVRSRSEHLGRACAKTLKSSVKLMFIGPEFKDVEWREVLAVNLKVGQRFKVVVGNSCYDGKVFLAKSITPSKRCKGSLVVETDSQDSPRLNFWPELDDRVLVQVTNHG